MADLKDYRKEIDEIDAQLIPLFERRMEVVRQVARYKKAHDLPVLQTGREREVLDRAAALLSDRGYENEARRFMEAVMEISRAAQQKDIARMLDGPVGFYGAPGSFSEEALLDHFGAQRARVPCAEFEDVFLALQKKEIDYGVLPIENSSTGGISKVYDLLGQYGFSIVGERRLQIGQNLVGLPGASLETVKTVYSHAQGLEQSSAFLARHRDWKLVPYHSTALSARYVAECGDVSKAAIASRRAVDLYHLELLAEHIQDRSDNETRFIVIGRAMETSGADKVSVLFALDHQAGTLYHILQYFADNRINLVKIESRPMPGALWHYLFYLDFEGDIDNAEVRTVLELISRGAKDFRILGAYRADRSR